MVRSRDVGQVERTTSRERTIGSQSNTSFLVENLSTANEKQINSI